MLLFLLGFRIMLFCFSRMNNEKRIGVVFLTQLNSTFPPLWGLFCKYYTLFFFDFGSEYLYWIFIFFVLIMLQVIMKLEWCLKIVSKIRRTWSQKAKGKLQYFCCLMFVSGFVTKILPFQCSLIRCSYSHQL